MTTAGSGTSAATGVPSSGEAAAQDGGSSSGTARTASDAALIGKQVSAGFAARENKDLAGASGIFTEVLQHDPSNGQAHYGLGMVNEDRKSYAAARHHYQKALEIFGETPSMKGILQRALVRVDASEKAAKAPPPPPPPPAAPEEIRRKDRPGETFRQQLLEE